ncbi:MAG: sulfotransferase [Leptolyngbyaceae cyanobacterium]
MTLTSLGSIALSHLESWRYDAAVAQVNLPEDLLFVLGHWRSGTTLLHELLALDTEPWAFANTYEVMNPQTFLLTEAWCSRWLAGLVPQRRPMDNMPISFQSPQEDEFAIALLTLQSYYLSLAFPAAEQRYERYLTLEALSPCESQHWQGQFVGFLKKLIYKYQRSLVLKSPPHTARIGLLLNLFPQARFDHIHRHPYAVFQSMRHYYHTAGWLTYLQSPNFGTLDQAILRRYRLMYDAYFQQRSLIPANQFCEIAFADLAAAPLATGQKIYRQFDLPYTPLFDQQLQHYLQGRQRYRKNQFATLTPATQRQITHHRHQSFEQWRYLV